MTLVSAFDDDALGDLDAVGVDEAYESGTASRTEVIEAAIARTEKANPELNGLEYEAFDRARTRARATTAYGGYFDGVPTFIKDNIDDFLLYCALLSFALVRGGKNTFGESFDRTRLDNLTLGLAMFAGGNLHHLPAALARLATLRRRMLRQLRDFDVLLTPTLAAEPPRIGHLDPTADYDQIIDRLVDWVAFTPLQNVTGEPAISLPLAQSASGLPIGIMFSAQLGHDATLLQLAYELEAASPFQGIQSALHEG
jgi:Asp-tRNA(Asn)/Glu-tRNA(Gln) amidotransferase A subunit family amidase